MDSIDAPAAVDALLAGREDVARMLGISKSTLDRLDAMGGLPEAVRLGGRKLWEVEGLRQWAAAGCPDRGRWEAILDSNRRRRPAH